VEKKVVLELIDLFPDPGDGKAVHGQGAVVIQEDMLNFKGLAPGDVK